MELKEALAKLKTQQHEQEVLASLGANTPAPTTPKSTHYSPGKTSSLEEKAINLLGNGVSSEATAAALGVSPARISQMLSQDDFAAAVTELRYKNLQKHNDRDAAYDSLEDELLAKLKANLGLIFKPEQLLRAIATINGAKRRGQDSPDSNQTAANNIVNITLPNIIVENFTVNSNNQVIKAGQQDLLTIQSGTLMDRVSPEVNKDGHALDAPDSNGQ